MCHPSNISADPLNPRKLRESHTKGGGPELLPELPGHLVHGEAAGAPRLSL